jgi:hypothetical protein
MLCDVWQASVLKQFVAKKLQLDRPDTVEAVVEVGGVGEVVLDDSVTIADVVALCWVPTDELIVRYRLRGASYVHNAPVR